MLSHLRMENPQNIFSEQIQQLRDHAFFFIDTDGIIRTWNPGLGHLLGYSPEEWLGKHTAMIFAPDDQAVCLAESEMHLASLEGSASDIRWHKRNDSTDIFAHGV